MPGKSARIEHAFAPRQIARLARRLARTRRVNRLGDDFFHHRGILLEELAQLVVDELRHLAGDIAVELALGLPFELRLRNLHADHRRQAFADVVAGQILFHVLEQTRLLSESIDGARERAAEAAQMRAAIHRVDVIGEAEQRLRVAVVILQSDLNPHRTAGARLLAFDVNRILVQHGLAAVQMLDELRNAAVVKKYVLLLRLHAFVASA